MLKTLLSLLILSLPLQVLGEDQTIDRIKDLKSYLAQVERESSDILLTDIGHQFKFSLNLFAEAIAAQKENCFYGGWPSQKVTVAGKSYCTSPQKGSDLYFSGGCDSINEIQCQPQLFGPNLCVGFTTKDQRINTFKNCEDAFKKEMRDYSYVSKMTGQELESLKEIEFLAYSLCKKNPRGSTQSMCGKILKRVAESKSNNSELVKQIGSKVAAAMPVKESNEVAINGTQVIMTPDNLEGTNGNPKTDTNGLSDSECAATIADNFQKIESLTNSIAGIMSKYGDKNIWPREDKSKEEVVDLQEEVLCLELEIFSLGNKLNLDINCKASPKKLPPMHMTLTKHQNLDNFEAAAKYAITKKMKELTTSINKNLSTLENVPTLSETGKQDLKDRIEAYRTELECLKEIDTKVSCPNSYGSNAEPTSYQTKADFAGLGRDPLVTIFVEKEGKLLPFKSYDELVIQGAVGPKTKQGDMMTPEGVFKITTPTTNTNYFSASKLDYENWKERKEMLQGLPNSMVNPSDKGGAILIHGAGGSNGCLSFNKNSDSAYFTALARNKTKAGEPLKMSVYPAPLTDELIESSNSIPELKMYKNFWSKLAINYKQEQDRTNSNVLSLDEIQDQQKQ